MAAAPARRLCSTHRGAVIWTDERVVQICHVVASPRIAAAYRHGNAAIRLEGLSEAERPQLKIRPGLDAPTLIPAAASPEIRVSLPCPYPGMRPYTADDADHFHGRGAEIDKLIGRLRAGERELCVLGPSGSGKSSLVASGILPRLARGVTVLGPLAVR